MRNLAILAILLTGLVACGGGKSSQNATSAPAASQAAGSESSGGSMSGDSMSGEAGSGGTAENGKTIPNCGAVKAVWANLKTHVYHEPGDPWYGKTKSGEYLCPSQAKAQGFHRAGAGAGSSHS